MTTGLKATVLLAAGREALNRAFELLYRIGLTGEIPCSAIVLYNTLRERQMTQETTAISAFKAQDQHPPEDAPRSLAIFGACPPNAVDSGFSENAKAGGKRYLQEIAQRKQVYAKKYAEAALKDADLRGYIEEQRRGIGAPALPIEVMFTLGGTHWTADQAKASHTVEIAALDDAAITSGVIETAQLITSLAELAEARSAPPALGAAGEAAAAKDRGWIWWTVGGIGAAVVVGGGLWYAFRRKADDGDGRFEASPVEAFPELEEEHDDDGDDDGTEVRPRSRHRGRARGRRSGHRAQRLLEA